MSYDSDYMNSPPNTNGGGGMSLSSVCMVIVVLLVGFFFLTMSTYTKYTSLMDTNTSTSTTSTTLLGSTSGPTPNSTSAASSSFCQTLSNKFNRFPGGPPIENRDIESTWVANQCTTVPSDWTCQDISDAYNVDSETTTHPLGVNKTYKERNCNTKSQYTCQKLSDTYNIFPDNGWVFDVETNGLTQKQTDVLQMAKNYTGDYFGSCVTLPSNMSCQSISNFYNIGPSASGTPRNSIGTPSAQGIFKNKKCKTNPMICSNIYQTYGTAFPPNDYLKNSETNLYVQQAWNNNQCTAGLASLGPYKLLADQATWSPGVKVLKRATVLKECTDFCNKTPACKMVLNVPGEKWCEARDKAVNSFPSKGRHSYIKI